ncbi:bifunctional (p)ppGpp synthetase/guanosine-3',5'-bis(diphosphate) 3'-pyrophosphohydrolase, partial [bacterium]
MNVVWTLDATVGVRCNSFWTWGLIRSRGLYSTLGIWASPGICATAEAAVRSRNEVVAKSRPDTMPIITPSFLFRSGQNKRLINPIGPMVSSAFEIPHEWDEPHDLQDMLDAVREIRPDANVRKIRYAYFLAEHAHKGQTRDSGLPYIVHPLAVARTVVDLRMDDDSIVAALLHDVLEDCKSVTADDIQKAFGADVLHLVEGVTKLDFKPIGEMTDRQRVQAETTKTAETLRKMLLAMAKDFRVMVIKLADRLHNMQTIDAVSPARKARIANETLDVYAPLAARLGIWQLK